MCVNVKNEASGRPERVDLLGRLGRPFLVHDPEVWFQELCLSYAAPSCRRGGQHFVAAGPGPRRNQPMGDADGPPESSGGRSGNDLPVMPGPEKPLIGLGLGLIGLGLGLIGLGARGRQCAALPTHDCELVQTSPPANHDSYS